MQAAGKGRFRARGDVMRKIVTSVCFLLLGGLPGGLDCSFEGGDVAGRWGFGISLSLERGFFSESAGDIMW